MIRRSLPSLSGLLLLVPAAPARYAADPAQEMVTKVVPLLRASGGSLSPEVRGAMLDWAEARVVAELTAAGRAPSPAIPKEVDGDADARDAVFGSVFPPDPSILQNVAALRAELGTAISGKYRALILALAVAKRTHGVSTAPAGADVGRDYQPEFWTDESLRLPGTDGERAFVRRIADYMAGSKVSALELYDGASAQVALRAYLAAHGEVPERVAEVCRSVPFGERLKAAMVLPGQRPGAREAKPSTLGWARYLIHQIEARPSSTPDVGGRALGWPLFPVADAPWPLLMPLAHPVPLGEARYIWETFQGEHGPDRFQTYGPWREDPEVMPDALRPSPWFWDAWPDRSVHGGMCVPISKGTVDLYSALGKPAMWAGQPGHANLVSFGQVGGQWTAEVEQAFAGGPEVTFAQWYFDETAHGLRTRDMFLWAGAEHHLGLALAMNLGLKGYVDTRMAANLFRALPEADRKGVGMALLRGAIRTNPYNPEPWYLLAENAADPAQGALVMRAVMAHDPRVLSGGSSGSGAGVGGPAPATDQYWSTLAQFTTRYSLLAHAPPTDEAEARDDYRLLRTVPGVRPADLAGFVERLPTSGEGLRLDQAYAAAGDAFGLVRLGMRCRDGGGVAVDEAQARGLFARAASQGDPVAAVMLGGLTPTVTGEGIRVVASSVYGKDQGPENLVDGAGMAGLGHDNEHTAKTMWHTASRSKASSPAPGLSVSPAWVRFDFPRPTRFDAVLVWNHNQEGLTDRGMRRVRLYGTTDGTRWLPLTAAPTVELPRASGAPSLLPTSVPVARLDEAYRAVILAAEAQGGNYGSADTYGLSAVRFAVRPLTGVVPASMVSVTASSEYDLDQGARHLVDGAGLAGLVHDNQKAAHTMWHTRPYALASAPAEGLPTSPAWVRFDFARPQAVESLMIWNHNQEGLTDRGFRRTRLYGTTDGRAWFPLTDSGMIELPRAEGQVGQTPTQVPIATPGHASLRGVIVAADATDGNYGSPDVYGLSAVRFVLATTPRDEVLSRSRQFR